MLTLDQVDDQYGILWRFDTARYTVAFWAEPDGLNPADSFEREEDIEFASDGEPAHWFCGFVGVFDADGDCLGYDCLGGCSYNSFREFYSSHRDHDPANRNTLAMKASNRVICHYFPSMVSEAIKAARVAIAQHQDGEVGTA